MQLLKNITSDYWSLRELVSFIFYCKIILKLCTEYHFGNQALFFVLSCFHNYQTHVKCIIFLSFDPHKVDIIILTCKIQFSSVTQHCLTLCNCMVCSTPCLPFHHQFPEFAQTRLHWVSDAVQPSHPLSSPSPPAFNLSQHQGHF